jgi:hypothetical protein
MGGRRCKCLQGFDRIVLIRLLSIRNSKISEYQPLSSIISILNT